VLALAEVGQALEPQLAMLETIREYGVEQLEASGEEAVRRAHAAYVTGLAEAARPKLEGLDQGAWLARLETEHNTLRAALAWVLGQGEAECALRLGGVLHHI
jgi:predicted ATPase